MLNVGLIGFGLAGRAFHAPLIAVTPTLRLAAVVTSRAQEVAALYPEARVLPSADALLADPAIDLVVVATPNDSHVPLARGALEAGKHVVVDKPLALTVQDGRDLAALAARHGRMLTVFHNRRWDADFRTVEQVLREGRLGDVHLAELRWDRFRPAIKPGWRETPRAGAGLLADLGPHLIDQAIRLFGLPGAVSADIAIQRAEAQVDDYFELALHYGSRRVIVGAASLVAAARPRFALHGTRGSFVKQGIDPQEAVLRAGGRPTDLGYGIEPDSAWGMLVDADAGERRVPSAAGEWPRFYEMVAAAITSGGSPPVEPRDAIAGLELIELARQSAREGRCIPYSVR
ncbi:oxidoreductase [Sphingomonas desiccabilis]|uniref:Oxidoreductase n=1 Tax=Sphingomonas desiccabilis TaxID=429134 RepID=A0A4V1QPP5_9SPHN|nr:oxidoreductase [Sphingomonas desiccabilis]MBB3909840.1 scyllo-inositol 2-dehydrogenase (NADP+) [Sphingomonas desiccabilis]RXZ34517.1 oxidoreductase [Sphingomonas desiccabilis]